MYSPLFVSTEKVLVVRMEHRTSFGIFMALAANRPMTALSFLSSPSARIVRNTSRAVMKKAAASTPSGPVSVTGDADLVDVDANLLHPDLASDIEHHIQVAASVGVRQFVVPGSTVEDSNAALDLANRKPNIVFPTAGVHPYHVEVCGALDEAMASIAALAASQDVRCVGECGLDFSEGFPPADSQLPWFERQVQIACELKKPLFLHEREAFGAFSEILRRYDSSHGLPPCLVHCFTGTPEEAAAYVDMGFFVSVAGGICREKTGKMLRDAVKRIPLDRLMVETDAPYLGFKGCRKGHANPKKQNPNVPSALPAVVEVVSGCLGIPFDQVAKATVKNSRDFLGIKER